jgi:hypothetical protein
MARYRMYFVDRMGKFRWPYDLYAGDDGDALAMAHALQYACSDVPVGVELWQGARRIPGTSNRTPGAFRASWDAVSAQKQEALLQMTEALRNSGTAVARSRRLLERMNALRSDMEHKRNSLPPGSAAKPQSQPFA